MLDDNLIGNILWSFIFSFGVVFPLALNRTISALRHASYFSFFCGFYVVLVIVITCLSDRDVVPDLSKSLKEAATTSNFTGWSFFQAFPLIVFSFMYQPNLPAVYSELKNKTYSTMWTVIFFATSIACVCYALAGYFGYATFACEPDVKEIMEMENIFEAPYKGNKFILVGKLVLLAGSFSIGNLTKPNDALND